MDPSALKRFEGEIVELKFSDGQRVIAKLISVDPGSPGREVIYDVMRVLEWGDVDPAGLDPEAAAAVAASEIQAIGPVREASEEL